MTNSNHIERSIKEVIPINPALVAALNLISFKAMRCLIEASLPPEIKVKRARQKLISRSRHPSRSKFYGVAACHRQRFNNRCLRWSK